MSDELAATPGRFRKLTGAPAAILRALLITLTALGSLWALEIHHHFEVTFFKQQYLALFLALALGSVFLAVKTYPTQAGDSVPWYDWLLALRSEEHTSELQSLRHLVCRLLLENKNRHTYG